MPVINIKNLFTRRHHQRVAAFDHTGPLGQRTGKNQKIRFHRRVTASFFPGCRYGAPDHDSGCALQRSLAERISAFRRLCSFAASRLAARRKTALTRSTRSRCEKGLVIKSSAPSLRPNSLIDLLSLDVRKITGMSDFWRQTGAGAPSRSMVLLISKDSKLRRTRPAIVPERRRHRCKFQHGIPFCFECIETEGRIFAVVPTRRDCLACSVVSIMVFHNLRKAPLFSE